MDISSPIIVAPKNCRARPISEGMDPKFNSDTEPDLDPDFVYPCIRCAQRAVLKEELMTGANLCCFVEGTLCGYCFERQGVCLPVPAEIQPLVQQIVNVVDNLDTPSLPEEQRRVLVEKGRDLGRRLHGKWAHYQRGKIKKGASADDSDNGKSDEQRVTKQNAIFLELTKEAAVLRERTNSLLEQQNALLSEQNALLHQLSDRQDIQHAQLSDLMRKCIDDQAKYGRDIVSELRLNPLDHEAKGSNRVDDLVDNVKSVPPRQDISQVAPTSPRSEVDRLLNTFVGKTRKRMSSTISSPSRKRPHNRSCTGWKWE